jgi:hypothetical protein
VELPYAFPRLYNVAVLAEPSRVLVSRIASGALVLDNCVTEKLLYIALRSLNRIGLISLCRILNADHEDGIVFPVPPLKVGPKS